MKKINYALLAFFCLIFFNISLAAPGEIHPPQSHSARLWNLQDADILSVINEVSLETGKNFVVDPRVTGKISLISSKPIKANETYHVFLSILELLGYSAIPSGNVVKIVPNMESAELAGHIANKFNPGKGDEVVVRVIPLQNVSASQVVPVLRPLLPQWSNLSVYAPGNVLILVGRAANLQRLLGVIENIDKASNNNIEMVRLHQASAAQIAAVLTNLQNTSRVSGDAAQISIAADERSNSILLSGNQAGRLRMRLLILQLDKPSASGQGNTDVIYLRYLQAKSFAPVLGKIAQNLTNSNTISTATITKTKDTADNNQTNIQAEPSTNSLIITAPPTLMKSLKSVVAKLDIRPAQVLVESIIVQIDQNDLNNLGIQWGGLVSATTFQAANTGFQPFGLGNIGIIPSQQVEAVLSFLQTQTSANILSTPSVVVLDNHKAVLEVGQNVPYQSGSYASTGSTATVTPFNTTTYMPVSLKLEVTPQINLGNSVRLSIKLENNTLQHPDNPGPTPLTNISRIQNNVIIDSADILVLGGLISNNLTDSVDKVPFIGNVPLLGNLFTHKTRRLEKKNLIVFIKPIIMHDTNDAAAITQTKYTVTRNAQINWPVDLSNPGTQKTENILPLWKNNTILPKPFQNDL